MIYLPEIPKSQNITFEDLKKKTKQKKQLLSENISTNIRLYP